MTLIFCFYVDNNIFNKILECNIALLCKSQLNALRND